MQIVICDDLKVERETLRKYIYSYCFTEVLDYVVEEFESAESLLSAVRKGKIDPDILFMDIYLEGMTGMEAVKLLKAEGFSGAVIFTTTSQSHAVESYRIMADGYLCKPYTQEEFDQNLKQIMNHYYERFKTISFLSNRLECHVFLKDIEYIEASSRGSLVHVKGEIISTTKPLNDFAEELTKEDCFLRCHRGCIVNLNYVSQVEYDCLLMKDGSRAALTIKNKSLIKKAIFDYFFLKMREV